MVEICWCVSFNNWEFYGDFILGQDLVLDLELDDSKVLQLYTFKSQSLNLIFARALQALLAGVGCSVKFALPSIFNMKYSSDKFKLYLPSNSTKATDSLQQIYLLLLLSVHLAIMA